jgi:hypothetical protein
VIARLAAVSCVTLGPVGAQLKVAALDSTARRSSLSLRIAPVDTQDRARAIAHSDFYYTRLKVHRIGSYAMLPLFAAQYYVGDRLLNDDHPPGWARGAHGTLAGGVAALFAVNTVTGVWNAWESRHDANGRARKYVHVALMIAADVGFLWTAQTAEDDDEGGRRSNANVHHRNIALGSIGIATVGTAMMWLWK